MKWYKHEIPFLKRFFPLGCLFEYTLKMRKKHIRERIRAHDKPMSKEKKAHARTYTNADI